MTANAKPRVLHVLNDLNRLTLGGVGTYLKSALDSTVSDAFDVRVAGIGGGEWPQWLRNVDYHGSGRSNLGDRVAFAAWLLRNAHRYAVVHLHLIGWALGVGAPVCLMYRIPYVLSVHGGFLSCHEQRDRQRRESIKLALVARSAALVATSERDLPALRAASRTAHIVVVPPALGIGAPSARSPSQGTLRLVFVGRLQPFKDVGTLLSAIGVLRDRGVPVHLNIVGAGDPDYERQLHQIVQSLQIGSLVTFCGHLEGAALQSAYAQADAFVLSSLGENFSFVTAEAMSAGLPCVVSEAVALADTVRRNNAGTVVPVGDAKALADALAAYQDATLVTQRGANARAAALSEFSLSAMGSSLIDVYSRVLQAAGRQVQPGAGPL